MDEPPDHETSRDTPQARFGAALRRLRVTAGLSQRDLGRRLHRAASTISEFENGWRLPRDEVAEQYENYFGLPGRTLVDQLHKTREELIDLATSPDERADDVACPYKGLRPFESEDAALFFGRESQVERVVARLAEVRFVAVVGPSGSGKSSFVRAGLHARISETWSNGATSVRIAELTPGEHPVDELATAVSAATGGVVGVAAGDVRADPDSFGRAVRHPDVRGLVIVVDQLEELFTLCGEEVERRCFVDALIAAWSDPSSPVVVILALRADLYGRVALYPQLAAAVVAHQTLIGPLSPDELRRAIEQPAERAGLALQSGLVETILADLAGEPGALPLLSHALFETCERRTTRTLTVGDYQQAGGVRGAIAQTAEDTLQSLPDADRAIARSIFLSLTDLAESTEPTRRRVDLAELGAHPQTAEAVDRVLGVLADARLVTIDERTVVLAHEALIGHWPRLRGWIDGDRAGLLIHRRLTDDAREWDTLHREPGALYRGARLAAAREWATDHADEVSAHEREFLSASHASAQRNARRLRWLAIGLAVLSVIVAVLAALALDQRNNARSDATKSAASALAASSFEPLTTRPDVSLALAFEAYRMAPRPLARSAVTRAVVAARQSRLRAALTAGTELSGIAVSSDGTTLASGGADGTVRLWDPSTGSPSGRLTGHNAAVNAVAFSPDGKILASAGDDGTVLLWNPKARTRTGRLGIDNGAVKAVAFSPDGKTVASAGDDGMVHLWDLATRAETGRLRGHRKAVYALAFSPDGKTLVSTGQDTTVRRWDPRSHTSLGRLRGNVVAVYALAFSPDGKTLAGGSFEAVHVWDPRTRKHLGRLDGHRLPIFGVAFSPDSKMLATASLDRTVVLWDRTSGKRLARLTGHTGSVIAAAFTPDGDTLATASDDKTVRLWRPATRAELGMLDGHTEAVRAAAYSPDGTMLASAGEDGTVRLWDTATGDRPGRLTGQVDGIHAVAFSADAKKLVSTSVNGSVILWDLATNTQPSLLYQGRDGSYAAAFSPDGRTLATAHGDGTVHLWDPATRRQTGRLSGHTKAVYSIAFSPDGKTLATGSYDETVVLWDPVTHKRLRRLADGSTGVNAVAFSPDGKTLAVASDDGAARLWDLAERKPPDRLNGHTDNVQAVAFSPDGKTLATASVDKTVLLWDPATHTQLGRLTGHTDSVNAVAFSPDGKTLATAGDDKTVRVWGDMLWRNVAELRATVCDIVLTGLTRADWEHYAPGIRHRRSCP